MNTETKVSLVLPVNTIRERLNRDPEFLLTARFWYCDIRFFIGSDPYFMRIENGKVDRFQFGTQGFDPYTINIGGPEEVWKKMMERQPEPSTTTGSRLRSIMNSRSAAISNRHTHTTTQSAESTRSRVRR